MPPRQDMKVAYMLSFISLTAIISGCITVPMDGICNDKDCYEFSAESFSDFLGQDNAFDIISYSESHDQMRVEAFLITEQENQRGEIYWNVAKDQDAGLSSVASRLVLGETVVIDNEYIEGNKTNNFRVGNLWYEGRDEIPEFSNPFIKLAKAASEKPDGFWPPFTFNTNEISDLDWSLSIDHTSNQQVASAVNDTHSIYIETRGIPPAIVGIETYSGNNNFILKVSTENVSISLINGILRAPAPFVPNPMPTLTNENITYWSGLISDTLSIEINPEELEIHALAINGDNATSISSMRFDLKNSNVTLTDGSWWEFNWMDYRGENLVSNGDLYTVRTNSSGNLGIAIYDLWAFSWTDQVF